MMLKKYAFLLLISLFVLLLSGLAPSAVMASDPLGITLTPTEEVTSTPESPTVTPESPTETPPAPTPTETPPVQPPGSSPTPTSQLTTPPAPTDTPEEPEEEEEPTPLPPPVLPQTGEGPLNPVLGWTGLAAAFIFALIGTLLFRALFRSRMPE
jgi:hypothetical protein